MKTILVISVCLISSCASIIPGAYMYDTRPRDAHGCVKNECYWGGNETPHCVCKGDADYGNL